jgi:antitoxin HicB
VTSTISFSEEGLLEEAEALAVKRILAFQIKELMESQNLSKTEMARRMQTSRAALERLLDPENRSVTLHTMDKAAPSLREEPIPYRASQFQQPEKLPEAEDCEGYFHSIFSLRRRKNTADDMFATVYPK